MTIIAISGIYFKITIQDIVKLLAAVIKGHFEGLTCINTKKQEKVAYLRLSDKLDPVQVIRKINEKKIKRCPNSWAYIPDKVPDHILNIRTKQIPLKLRQSLKIPPNLTQEQIIIHAHQNIMKEMQYKYTGLFDLSLNTGHELLITIGQTVLERLIKIQASNNIIDGCFKLTNVYRKRHPHFADFQFILSTLHMLQDAAGKPREQIQESELVAVSIQPYVIDNIPFDKVQSACGRYADKITTKILDHVKKLELQAEDNSLEAAARVKVREQLQKLVPYLPTMIRQVIQNNFIPQQAMFHIVKIYGEPFLPGKDIMGPFMKRRRAMSVIRSDRMFNLLNVKVPRDAYMGLLAADGTLVGGAKLVIRPANLPLYKFPSDIRRKEVPKKDEQEMEKEECEEWSESWE